MKPAQYMAAWLWLAGLAAAFGGGEYLLVDLGTLGGANSAAHGINDRGQVVGTARDTNGLEQAFRWEQGQMTGLGFLPGGPRSVATDINNAGEVCGRAQVSPTNLHAFLWTTNGLQDLGTLGGPNSYATALNDRGEITGSTQLTTNIPNATDPTAFLWRSNQMIRIPPFHNYYSCDGYDINNRGRVVGSTFAWIAQDRWWGFLWYDKNNNFSNDIGEMRLLGTHGGEYSGANAINQHDQVAGWAQTRNGLTHAFLITPVNDQWKIPDGTEFWTNALMRDLGALDAFTNQSWATAVNDQGWVVGYSTVNAGGNRAFLWREGAMTNLNDLLAVNPGWVLTSATDINNNGEITGYGTYAGQTRAFLLVRGGFVTHFTPSVTTETIIYTNMAEVLTQTWERVTGLDMRWTSIWTNPPTIQYFTVETPAPDDPSRWEPVAPTQQWPITDNFWTNAALGAPGAFFRIRATW